MNIIIMISAGSLMQSNNTEYKCHENPHRLELLGNCTKDQGCDMVVNCLPHITIYNSSYLACSIVCAEYYTTSVMTVRITVELSRKFVDIW
jgi:hypothetical protein